MKTYKIIILVLLIAFALFIFAPSLSWAAEDGGALYHAKCAACHGPDAAGKPAMKTPAIKGLDEAAIKKGLEIPKHAAVKKSLLDEQIKAIAEYLHSLK